MGVVVLLGWALELPWVRSVGPDLVEMKPNTALGFLLAGGALWLLAPTEGSDRRASAGRVLAGLLTTLALATMSEYVMGWDLGIDQLLFLESPEAIFTSSPGRMAFATTVDFALIGAALLLLDVRTRRGFWPAQGLALAAGGLAYVAAIGYLYGAQSLYGVGPWFTPIALHTALAFVALALGVLASRPDRGLIGLGERPGAGGAMVRRLTATAVLLPSLLGWLELQGERAGVYEIAVGLSLLTAANIGIFTALIWANGSSIQRSDHARARAEDALRTRAEDLDDLYNRAPCGYHSLGRDGVVLRINDTELDWLGYAREEVVGKLRFNDLLAEESLAIFADHFPRFKREGRVDNLVFDMVRKDGSTFPVLLSATAVMDGEGEFLMSRSTIVDITAREEAEREARQTQEFLDSVIENLPTMVFVKDAEDLRFVRINRAGEDLLGVAREELIGRSDYDSFPVEQADLFTGNDREVLENRRLLDIPEEPIQTKHGPRLLHTRKIPILTPDGDPRYLLGISEDITERRRAEEELSRARTEAERANRAKDEFLSRMSHELRTPLNAVLGFAQLLELDESDPVRRDNVGQILKGGRHLLGLIDEVLDISRIATGTVSLSPEPVSVTEVVFEVVGLIRPLAAERGIVVHAEDANGVHVLADRQRLKQVLLNLLSNAVKYNRDVGSVDVGWSKVAGERLRVAVSDTGAGIPAWELERLFVPFDRLGADATGIEGTGLGLALAKALTEAMGGMIHVESRVGTGSTFAVEFPLAEPPLARYPGESAALAPGSGHTQTRTVLYLEDNMSNLRLVERILENSPHLRLITAMQGRLGLELARKHRPDVILLDVHLPDITGEEVLRDLRERPETRGIPVIAVSADATPGSARRLLSQGAHHYLTKPLDIRRFLEVLEAALVPRPDTAGIGHPEG